MAASLEQAIAAVRASYGSRWLSLEATEQTRAIYREMRRLDLEEVMTRRALARTAMAADGIVSPHGHGLVRGDTAASTAGAPPQCSAFIKTRRADRCTWQAVVVHEGQPYCGFHNPLRRRISRNCGATEPPPAPGGTVRAATQA